MFSIHKMRQLFLNHVDAYVVTLVIALGALIFHQSVNPQTIYWLAAMTVGYWGAFALNDFHDATIDAFDETKAQGNFFIQNPLGRRSAIVVVALYLAFVVPSFVQFGRIGIVVLSFALFVAWAYSAPPLRLKSRPGLDLVVHAVCVETFPYLAALLLIDADWTRLDGAVLSLTVLGSLSAQVEQQIRDYHLDIQHEQTFTTSIGLQSSMVLLRLLTVLLIGLATVYLIQGVLPTVVVPMYFIALPVVAHRLLRPVDQPRSPKLTQLTLAATVMYVAGISLAALF